MKFTIDRTKWLRGVGAGRSALWNVKANKGCCLGHVIEQYGTCSFNEMDKMESPSDLCTSYVVPEFLMLDYSDIIDPVENKFLRREEKYWVGTAMVTNDDDSISDEQRELKLISLFSANGIELEFYN